VQQLRLLSKLEQAGLLTLLEKNGVTLTFIEKSGLLSKAESLGLLSAAADRYGPKGAVENPDSTCEHPSYASYVQSQPGIQVKGSTCTDQQWALHCRAILHGHAAVSLCKAQLCMMLHGHAHASCSARMLHARNGAEGRA